MADRYETGQPSSSHSQGENNGTETVAQGYTLHELHEYFKRLRIKYKISLQLVESFNAKFKVREPIAPTERRTALLDDFRYHTEFLIEGKYNVSIIDLQTESLYEHGIITTAIADSLFKNSPQGGVLVIHIYCYEEHKLLTPLVLILMVLNAIREKLSTDSYRDCHSIIVGDKRRVPGEFEYDTTLKLLEALISRFLEKRPNDTIHFIFSGMYPCDMDKEELLSLTQFIIDMSRLVSTVLPKGAWRAVKCIFCGHHLFAYLLPYLRSEKQRSGNPEEKEIFGQMLMLKWEHLNLYTKVNWNTAVEYIPTR